MNAEETTQEKKAIPFSPSNASTSNPRRRRTTTGFCRRLSDCIIMGPATTNHIPRGTTKLHHLPQLEDINKELAKEKELKSMYKMRLERTQSFLKYCLQVAQDNGFLNLILNKHKDQEYFSLSPSHSSGQAPHPHPHLAALVNQAKINGWYIHPLEIEMHQLSAQGTTADIYKGRWRGVDVAVKCMYPDFFQSNDSGVSFFAQEVETLSTQRHPFVLQLMGACLDPPDKCWIVTEFLKMNLKDWLHGSGKRHKERTIPLPPLKDRLAKALEVAQAMQYLHESKPKIIHRDLKPSNIFLDDALHVRVADFGHARFLSDGEKALTGETDYGPSKIALEVAENGLRPSIAKAETYLEEMMIELIQQLWDQEAAARPSFNEITCNLRNILGDNKLEQTFC
ncbi:serine/threonine-protein kinase STY46-like isoform X2 [Primulina tabacum]|uniref:serine/threonine-protein kinase STY46-like isoform X2 n=1 Tax=Primulina tabacum TaxID=48773 RepID=UPI003F591AF2